MATTNGDDDAGATTPAISASHTRPLFFPSLRAAAIVVFRRRTISEGFQGARTPTMRKTGRGLRAGHVVGRFGEVVICRYRPPRSRDRRRIFVASAPSEGSRRAGTAGMRAAGPGLRAGRIGGRFPRGRRR